MSLPQMHRTGSAMAHVLVQYIADPARVRRLVLREFSECPGVDVIANMRKRFEQPTSLPPIAFKQRRHSYAQQMERANSRFVKALLAERKS